MRNGKGGFCRPSFCAPTYPQYPSYPQVEFVCATRRVMTLSLCGQEAADRKRTKASKPLPEPKGRMSARTEASEAKAGRGWKKREAKAKAQAAPTFRAVQWNQSVRAQGPRKGNQGAGDGAAGTRTGDQRGSDVGVGNPRGNRPRIERSKAGTRSAQGESPALTGRRCEPEESGGWWRHQPPLAFGARLRRRRRVRTLNPGDPLPDQGPATLSRDSLPTAALAASSVRAPSATRKASIRDPAERQRGDDEGRHATARELRGRATFLPACEFGGVDDRQGGSDARRALGGAASRI